MQMQALDLGIQQWADGQQQWAASLINGGIWDRRHQRGSAGRAIEQGPAERHTACICDV